MKQKERKKRKKGPGRPSSEPYHFLGTEYSVRRKQAGHVPSTEYRAPSTSSLLPWSSRQDREPDETVPNRQPWLLCPFPARQYFVNDKTQARMPLSSLEPASTALLRLQTAAKKRHSHWPPINGFNARPQSPHWPQPGHTTRPLDTSAEAWLRLSPTTSTSTTTTTPLSI